mmetsp:Transcript_113086/g.365263  ORF Transcript_113086/g.365263 Transcript_113086/m.365263 type:complete len:417 (-) Transcript_113086:546-1796(-)
MWGGSTLQLLPSAAAALTSSFCVGQGEQCGQRRFGSSARVSVPPVAEHGSAAHDTGSSVASVPMPLPRVVAVPQQSIRSSLGQRGGVVKKSDGFDVFYGLVGDQPAPGVAPLAAASEPSLASAAPAPRPSIRSTLGQRGGVVRKSDGFEVFYGLVGDQPEAPKPARKLRGPGAAAEATRTASTGAAALGAGVEGHEALAQAGSEDGAAWPAPRAPCASTFSLATPAVSYAPASGTSPELPVSAESRGVSGLHTALAGQIPRSVAQYSLATPAPSFAPGKRAPEHEGDAAGGYSPVPEEGVSFDAGEEPGELPGLDRLPISVERYSMATPAASFAPTRPPCEAAARKEPEVADGAVAAEAQVAAAATVAAAAERLGRRSTGSRGKDTGLQSKLDGLNDAIAKLKTIQPPMGAVQSTG